MLNCYKVTLATTNASKDTARLEDGYIAVEAGEVYYSAISTADVAAQFPDALKIERVGRAYAPGESMPIDYTKTGFLPNRYNVTRGDGKPTDDDSRFYVLRYDKPDEWGRATRSALRFFAMAVAPDFPRLSEELREEIAQYETEAEKPPADQPTLSPTDSDIPF